MKYNEIIRQLREDRDLTQEQVATILNCSQTAYSKYEKGLRELSISNLVKLAKFYNVSMDYITGLTDNPKPSYITKNKIDINNNYGQINMK